MTFAATQVKELLLYAEC